MPPASPLVPFYRARTVGDLCRFLDAVYHNSPHLTQEVTMIIIDRRLDGRGSSRVYEMLYEMGGYNLRQHLAGKDEIRSNVVENCEGPGDVVRSGRNWRADCTEAVPSLKYREHPFICARDDILLTTMEDDVQKIKDEGGLELYVRTVASLLTACENLEILHLPGAWVPFFPIGDFPKLKKVCVTD